MSHFDVGGAERVAVNIAKSQTEGFEYHVVELIRAHSAFTKVFIKELEDAGIKYHRGWCQRCIFIICLSVSPQLPFRCGLSFCF